MRWTVVVVMLLACPVAASPPPPEAKAHFEAGDKAYKLGDFTTAIDEYSKSYQAYPAPLLLYDLAQAYRQLGNLEKALFSYKQYLADAPTGKYRLIAEQKVAELEKLLEEQRKTKSSPPSGPAAAEKDPAAATPASEPHANPTEPRPVAPDSHGSTPAASIPAAAPVPAAAPAIVDGAASPPSLRRRIGIGASIAGAVIALAGGAMLLAAPAVYSSADTAANLTQYDSLHAGGRNLQVAGAVVGVVGVVAIAAGIVIALTVRGETRRAWIVPAVNGYASGGF